MTNSNSGTLSAGTVSWVTATAIVVADMVGVGVFTSLGFQVTDITSGFSLLLLWVVGGVVAICGAFCYAELATMFPRSSGEYNFLRRIYHPAFGFVAGWLSATVGFAAPIALAAMAFGIYFKSIIPGAPPLLLGFCITWLAALVHLGGVRFGGAYHNAWTALKLVLIVVFIVAGFAFGDLAADFICAERRRSHLYRRRAVRHQPGFRDVFLLGLERRDLHRRRIARPARNLPRALFAGTAIVIVLYVLPQCRLSDHHADEGTGRPDRRRDRRRQAHIRRSRRPHRRRAHLPRPGIVDQRHDLDRPARRP